MNEQRWLWLCDCPERIAPGLLRHDAALTLCDMSPGRKSSDMSEHSRVGPLGADAFGEGFVEKGWPEGSAVDFLLSSAVGGLAHLSGDRQLR